MKTFNITAGHNGTDLGVVGACDTFVGAKRIGRAAVRKLPDGEGTYYIHNQHVSGRRWGETCGLDTGFKWVALASIKSKGKGRKFKPALEMARQYPLVHNWSTYDYVAAYEKLNGKIFGGSEMTRWAPLNKQPATNYDPTQPICAEAP